MTLATKYSEAELLALIKTALTEAQVQQWEGREGEEFYEAAAAAMALASQRQEERRNGALIMRATGPTRATTTARVTWTAGTTLAQGMRAGQVLCGTVWGVTYRLAEDLEVAAAQAPGKTVDVAIEAVWSGWAANLPSEVIDQWALPGGVERKTVIDWTPSTTSAAQDELLAGVDAGTITVAATADATGGALGTLDMLGRARGLPRAEDEPDAAYRERIRSFGDSVTPAGILRAVNAAIEPYGVTATLLEPWDYGWTVGHVTRGTIGRHGPARPFSFIISVPDIGTSATGWTVGHATYGAIGRWPIGQGDIVREGVRQGLEALLRRIEPAGVQGRVVMEAA